jgi:hypothetical protein
MPFESSDVYRVLAEKAYQLEGVNYIGATENRH